MQLLFLVNQHGTAEIQSFDHGFSWESVWLEAVQDLGTARFRLNQLASANPGEYFVFDLSAKQVVVSLVSTNDELHAMRE
jgi:hypothetical protein